MNPEVGDKVYRADVRLTVSEGFTGLFGGKSRERTLVATLQYVTHRVTKLTPKGFWIGPDYGDDYDYGEGFRLAAYCGGRWCSHTTRYVAPTEEEALHLYVRRKAAHVKHAKRRLQDAEAALKAALKAAERTGA